MPNVLKSDRIKVYIGRKKNEILLKCVEMEFGEERRTMKEMYLRMLFEMYLSQSHVLE